MSDPRRDVYQITALLDALRRVMDPVASRAELTGRPVPVPPPKLPSDKRSRR